MSVDQILEVAKSLSIEEKTELVDKLLASIDPVAREDIDRAWGEEADRRMAAYKRGEVAAEPVEDVIEALRKRDR